MLCYSSSFFSPWSQLSFLPSLFYFDWLVFPILSPQSPGLTDSSSSVSPASAPSFQFLLLLQQLSPLLPHPLLFEQPANCSSCCQCLILSHPYPETFNSFPTSSCHWYGTQNPLRFSLFQLFSHCFSNRQPTLQPNFIAHDSLKSSCGFSTLMPCDVPSTLPPPFVIILS